MQLRLNVTAYGNSLAEIEACLDHVKKHYRLRHESDCLDAVQGSKVVFARLSGHRGEDLSDLQLGRERARLSASATARA